MFSNGKAHENCVDENGHYILVNSKFVSTDGSVFKKVTAQLSPLFKSQFVMVMSDLPNGKALAKCYYIEEDNIYTLNQRICSFSAINGNISRFLMYQICRNKYYLRFDDGINQTNLKKREVLACPVFIPSKEEQTKIAVFLHLLDKRISIQNKIIEKLQSLIKGIRNNMMIQNQGDYIALQDIADIYQPKTILSTDLTEDGYLVYGANGIIGKYHLYNHEKEQICITCRGNTCGTVNYTEPKSWITGNAMVINTDNFAENVNKRYLFHYLSSINFNSIISGSGQPQIVRQPLAKLKIILPELTIQEHIAKCLDTILAKIKNEQTSLQAIQIQKSYLLSQMFI